MTVEIAEVAQDILRVDCGQVPVFLMPQMAYLVIGDEASALIEPGCTTAAAKLLSHSSRLGLELERVAYIIPTHIHVDHGGGTGFLLQHLPKAKAVLHPKGVAHMKDPSRLILGTSLAFGDTWEEHFGPILPVPEDRMLVAEEGEVISLGNRDLTIIFSPGHATHHISIFDSLTRGMFSGEALGFPSDASPDLVLPGGIPPFAPEAYVESIEKLEKLSPKQIFYSHLLGVWINEDNRLIRAVKESTLAFNRIVEQAVEDGEDDRQILQRLLDYVRQYSPEAQDLGAFMFDPSGYIDYYRNRR